MLPGLDSLPLRREFLRLFRRATRAGATGEALIASTTAASARAALGAGAVGASLFTSVTAADAKAVTPIISAPTVASTSGTSIDFNSIPSWVKRITVMLSGVSTNGTSLPIIQLGDAGGIETTGYLGATNLAQNGAATQGVNFTAGIGLTGAVAAASVLHVAVTLTLVDAATNTWLASVIGGQSNAANSIVGGSTKSLSQPLDRLRVTTLTGVDTFDAGSIGVIYE